MCRTLRKFACGTCESCYSSKRNSLAIRLKEHYRGYLRHYNNNECAILFGMLTFAPKFYPNVDFSADIVCHWQKPVQAYLKRLNKLYPFLKFEYFISAEVSEKGRLHCHPLWFVVPRDAHPNYKGANRVRFNAMLSALSDNTIYKVKLLHSSSKKRNEVRDFTAFELYVRNLLLLNWNDGLSECSPVLSSKAIVYCTKYMTKSRNDIFRRKVYISEDSTRKSSHFDVVDDAFFKYRLSSGYMLNPHNGETIPVIVDVPRQVKRFYKYIYKSYLISRAIGNFFYETPQWLSLFNNFQLDERILKLDDSHTIKLLFTPSLRWYDETHELSQDNKGYPLPLKYRQALYNALAPKDTLERDIIATAGLNKLFYKFTLSVLSLCQSHNIPYFLKFKDHLSLPDIILDHDNWKRLNELQLQKFNSIARLKQFLYEN